jgi:hypothetical protein
MIMTDHIPDEYLDIVQVRKEPKAERQFHILRKRKCSSKDLQFGGSLSLAVGRLEEKMDTTSVTVDP